MRKLKKLKRKNRAQNRTLPNVFIGLGNPGPEYSQSRHNLGFWVIDILAENLGIRLKKPVFSKYQLGRGIYEGKKIFLVKPLTYMNRSGLIIPSLRRKIKARHENIVIICDHLDLPPGICRLKRKGSSGGQKGLQSIIDNLGREDFFRLFIGIGRPPEGIDIPRYVLEKIPQIENIMYESAVKKAVSSLLKLRKTNPEQVMNELNRKK